MYELVQVSSQCYYINCPAKIGVYKPEGTGKAENGVYLIDSGNDKDAGKKVRKVLEQQGWSLLGILTTHSNADHIGGNKYLQDQTGCKVFAGGMEGAFTAWPLLEPTFLFGGFPMKEMRHKFLMAQPSEVTGFQDPDFPAKVEIIPLPGHFLDMVGYRMPDGTVFLADCISSRMTLEKYGIPFIYDVESYLKTMDFVEGLEAPVYVPSHTDVFTDAAELKALTDFNRQNVYEISRRILEICSGEAKCFEVILKEVFEAYGLVMTFEQYVLVGSTVKSFLAWMKDAGKIQAEIQENMLVWSAV